MVKLTLLQITERRMATNATGTVESGVEVEPAREDRVTRLRTQVDDVREIMTANVERVLARGERLEDLLDKSADLEAGSSRFRTTARRVERHMCWRNMKCNCIIAAIVISILIVIVVVILYETGAFKSGGGGNIPTPSTTTTTKLPLPTSTK